MTINPHNISIVDQALIKSGHTRTWFAEQLGYQSSWASKFFGGKVKHLSEGQVEQIQDMLGCEFYKLENVLPEDPITRSMIEDPVFSSAVNCLHKALAGVVYVPGKATGKQLNELGKQIQELAKQSKTPADLAYKVLKLLQ